jgi:hypothetical protein
LRRSRRINLIKIFSTLMADIDKILKSKIIINSREKLLIKYHDYLNIFNRTLIKRFPPLRFNINYKIILEKTSDEKDFKVP